MPSPGAAALALVAFGIAVFLIISLAAVLFHPLSVSWSIALLLGYSATASLVGLYYLGRHLQAFRQQPRQ